jgi:transposase
MRQVHKAGDKLFVDYSGKTPEIMDALTGVVRPVELFVAVLSASNYTADATEDAAQRRFHSEPWPDAGVSGRVPAAIVPDQLKPGVRDACRYEPILQRTYEEWAAHLWRSALAVRRRMIQRSNESPCWPQT